MTCFVIPFPFMPWHTGPKALCIDVHPQPDELEKELDALYGRLHRPGDALHPFLGLQSS
jgi:hypothetical protein